MSQILHQELMGNMEREGWKYKARSPIINILGTLQIIPRLHVFHLPPHPFETITKMPLSLALD